MKDIEKNESFANDIPDTSHTHTHNINYNIHNYSQVDAHATGLGGEQEGLAGVRWVVESVKV